MIDLSQRLHALPGYPLAEIPTIKRRLLQAGVDVIDLGAGDNDVPTDPSIVEAMREAVRVPALGKYGFQQGLLDFREAAPALVRRVRALAPSPGAATRLGDDRLCILAARAQPGPVDAEPGTLRRGAQPLLRIATGDGWLVPLVVQRAGGRALPIDAFLRGRPLPDGTKLGAGLDCGS